MSESSKYHSERNFGRKQTKEGTITKVGREVGRGDTKVVIDPEEVYKLSKLWCSYTEIAEYFGTNIETLRYNFMEELTKGRLETKQALRRQQIKVALSGNVPMLIWLGKNILDQSDHPTTDAGIAEIKDLIRPIIINR